MSVDRLFYKSTDLVLAKALQEGNREDKSIARINIYSSKDKMLPSPGRKKSSVVNLSLLGNGKYWGPTVGCCYSFRN